MKATRRQGRLKKKKQVPKLVLKHPLKRGITFREPKEAHQRAVEELPHHVKGKRKHVELPLTKKTLKRDRENISRVDVERLADAVDLKTEVG